MTIKDIAKLANVSPSTVSKIINGKADNIRPETREHVMNIVREYHYSPSDFIRQTSTERTYKLGLLLSSTFQNHEFIRGLISAAKRSGYFPVLGCNEATPEGEEKDLSFFYSDGIDGLLWERVNPQQLTPSRGKGIPIILLHEGGGSDDLPHPYSHYGYYAAETLISHGHRRIAFLSRNRGYETQQFFRGFQSCLTDKRIRSTADESIRPADQSAMELIKEGYTAALCIGKAAASALMRQLLQLNYIVPQDFSILLVAGTGEQCSDDFSVLRVPYGAYGEFLATRLIQMVEHMEPLAEFQAPVPEAPSLRSIGMPRDYLSKHILVVGSIHIDVNINSDCLPQLGRAVSVKALNISPGGKGLNQAVGVAKLKKEVYLIARTGSDYDGVVALDTLRRHHVRTDGVIRDPSDTGRAFIYILEDGESAITAYSGASRNLSVDDINRNRHLFSNAAYCLLQTEVPIDAIERSAALAKQNHAKVVLKPSSVNQISDALLAMTDYFIPNESEIRALCPDIEDNEERCRYFLNKGVDTVILTLGNRGCYLHSRTESCYFRASNHTAVDTTGGCDAFISALTACLFEGIDLHRAIYYANCAAGFCVSQLGVVPALIGREALDMYHYPEPEESSK